MSKITITVSGEVGSGTTHISALVLWALLKFNSRPNYQGANRGLWQQLAFDEHQLSKEVADLINKGLFFDIVEVETLPKPAALDPKDEELAKMKAELESMKKLLDAKSEQLDSFREAENEDNQKL